MRRHARGLLVVIAVILPLCAAAAAEDDAPREARLREIWEHRPTTEQVAVGIEAALTVPDWSARAGTSTSTTWTKVADVMVDPDAVHNKVGRVRCAAWAYDHDVQQRLLWVGTSSGGLYKFIPSWIVPFYRWVPVSWSLEGSPSVGAFVVNPWNSHKILIGTGDRGRGWDVGTGLYRTLDGGASWTKITLSPQPASFEKLVLDSADVSGNTVVAATQNGVWRSTNFGASWTRVYDNGSTTGVTDVSQDSTTGAWLLGVPGTGVVRCGSLTGGFCTIGQGIASPATRVSVAVAPSDPDWVFALVSGRYRCSGGGHPLCTTTLWCSAHGAGTCNQVDDGLLNGIYRSADGGHNFERIEPQGVDTISGGQGFHTHAIAVDPDTPARLMVGLAGVQMTFNATASSAADVCWRRNAGASCSSCCTLPGGLEVDIGHADQTSLQFVPDLVDPGNTDILATNDGGIYLYDWQANTLDDVYSSYDGLNVSQAYPLATDMAAGDHDRLLLGTQDNGVVRIDLGGGSYDYLPGPDGETGADGGPVSISASNPNHMGTSLGLPYHRQLSTDGGTWHNVDTGLAALWAPTVRFDRMPGYATIFSHDERTVYFRYPWDDPTDPWQVANPNHPLPSGVSISSLETARTNYTTLYLTDWNSATNGTALYVMDSFNTGGDLGDMNWEDRSPRPFGAAPPAGGMVAADRTSGHSEWVYFTTAGYRPSRAYLSPNRGQNWWDVTGSLATPLADVSLWQLVGHPEDNSKLFLAAETGVYRSDNAGLTWYRYMDGLPRVVKARALEIVSTGTQQARLVVATWGHGVWKRDVEFELTEIFRDGFEAGDTWAWSATAP